MSLVVRIVITSSLLLALGGSFRTFDRQVSHRLSTDVKERTPKIELSKTKADEVCPAGFIENVESGSCYTFIGKNITWFEANTICSSFPGAHLVEIDNINEHLFLVNAIQADGEMKTKNFWTGGNDLQKEGRWWWAGSGNSLQYTNWQPGEPSNGDAEDCLILFNNTGFSWHDMVCRLRIYQSIGHYGICEKTMNISRTTS